MIQFLTRLSSARPEVLPAVPPYEREYSGDSSAGGQSHVNSNGTNTRFSLLIYRYPPTLMIEVRYLCPSSNPNANDVPEL